MASRKEGKVIDTIHFCERGSDVKVDIRISKQDDDSFIYLVDHNEPMIKARDKDPKVLRCKVIEELRRALSIDWSPMIFVQTNMLCMQHSNWSSSSCAKLHGLEGDRELRFNLRGFDIGADHQGKPIYRFHHLDGHTKADDQVRNGSPVKDMERSECMEDDQPGSTALVADTPENRAKLQGICDALNTLAVRLGSLMNQTNIEHTLANVRLLGLPQPLEKSV